MTELTDKVISTIKLAAKELTGEKRRLFQARVANDYLLICALVTGQKR
jgi:hypothetical protein